MELKLKPKQDDGLTAAARILVFIAVCLFVFSILIATGTAHAATDYSCVSTCTSQGNAYGLCKDKCSYGQDYTGQQQQQQQTTRTDYNCVSKCTAEGNMYGLCHSRCSY